MALFNLFKRKQKIDPELEKRLEERGQIERIAELKKPTVPIMKFKPQLPTTTQLSKSESLLRGIAQAFELGANEVDILADIEKKRPDMLMGINKAKKRGANAFEIVNDIINKTTTSPEKKKEVLIKSPSVIPRKTFGEKVTKITGRRFEKVEELVDIYADKKQSLIETGFQTGAQGMAAVWETVFAGIGSAAAKIPGLTEKAEEVATDILTKVPGKWAVEAMSSGLESYEKWKNKSESNTRIGRNTEAAVEVIASLPVIKGMTLFKGSGKLATGIDAASPSTKSFIRKLLTPDESKAVKEARIKRTKVIPFTKKYVYTPTPAEKAMESAVYTTTSKTPFKGISPRKTLQQNYNIIDKANTKEAIKLEKKMNLQVSGYDQKGLLNKLKETATKLTEEHPLIAGDAGETMKKLMIKATQLIEDSSALTYTLFKVRKKYDKWIKKIEPDLYPKGAKVLVGDQRETALVIANREIRTAIHDTLYDAVPNNALKESLVKQHALFNAVEIVGQKAATEAKTRLGRIWQKAKKIIGARNVAVNILATIGGLTVWGTISKFGLPITGAIAGIGLTVGAGKILSKQPLRVALHQLLKELSKVKEKNLSPSEVGNLHSTKKEIGDFLETY